jgi:TatD DNase family protein
MELNGWLARCGLVAILRGVRPDEVVAIGECGLDFNRDFSPRPVQVEWFRAQVLLAKELGLPLFLHERDAAGAFLEVLDALRPEPAQVVVHCFTGTREELFDYLDQDWYIGITGWLCDERRGQHLRELVKHIPAARLMIETDAPFLAPVPHRGKTGEPAFVADTAAFLAKLRRDDVAELQEVTARNFHKLFNKTLA